MVVIVMGVVGAGKTTIGRLLARQLGWEFADADDFHPTANVEKIRFGVSLTDADRRPWLERLRTVINDWISDRKGAVLACSALKSQYRKILDAGQDVRFVYLKGSAALIAERLRAREGHSLLRSRQVRKSSSLRGTSKGGGSEPIEYCLAGDTQRPNR